ncbi:Imm1 family immunity protein [Kribbella sp. NPDC004536]|uniref:Imm1 family immunity protein n=1 Tax=Kribbella sp. NPDC004536 TaxID=3364106 RepID=UPI0036B100F8
MTYSLKAYYKHEHTDGGVLVTSTADVDALVEAMLAEPFENSVATLYIQQRPRNDRGYPDHELRVGLYPEGKVGSLRYVGKVDGETGAWYAVGRQSQRDEVFYYYTGHDEGYPQDSELPIQDIRGAIKDFLENGGGRPAALNWAEWPAHVG